MLKGFLTMFVINNSIYSLLYGFCLIWKDEFIGSLMKNSGNFFKIVIPNEANN